MKSALIFLVLAFFQASPSQGSGAAAGNYGNGYGKGAANIQTVQGYSQGFGQSLGQHSQAGVKAGAEADTYYSSQYHQPHPQAQGGWSSVLGVGESGNSVYPPYFNTPIGSQAQFGAGAGSHYPYLSLPQGLAGMGVGKSGNPGFPPMEQFNGGSHYQGSGASGTFRPSNPFPEFQGSGVPHGEWNHQGGGAAGGASAEAIGSTDDHGGAYGYGGASEGFGGPLKTSAQSDANAGLSFAEGGAMSNSPHFKGQVYSKQHSKSDTSSSTTNTFAAKTETGLGGSTSSEPTAEANADANLQAEISGGSDEE